MPQFLIEDTVTGLKLAVEGEQPPTQADAHSLITDELATLRTNLYQAPGNRFLLDVGPTAGFRKFMDKPTPSEIFAKAEPRIKAMADAIGTAILEPEGSALYSERLLEIYEQVRTEMQRDPKRDTLTLRTLEKLPENTLLLDSHGRSTGGLVTDWEHEFTLHNVARLLGPQSNAVRNIYNTACYGGRCNPQEYSVSFPQVTNLVSTAFTNENVSSLGREYQGLFFGEGVGVIHWTLRGGRWEQIPYVAPQETLTNAPALP